MKSEELSGSKVIVQHNSLINGWFDITKTEMAIFVFMLSKIHKDDNEFKLCKIPVNMIAKSKGGNTYKIIKNVAYSLLTKRFKLETLNINKKNKVVNRYKGYNIFSTSSYIEGENHIEIKFNDDIKDYLLNLKGNFTSAELENLLGLKYVHSYRIYWLLKQYQSFGSRAIEINHLKDMLMLKKDSGEYMYSNYSSFKSRVLDVAKEELTNTDMKFSYEYNKKTGVVQFKLSKKSNKPTHLPQVTTTQAIKAQPVLASDTIKERALKILVKYAISKDVAMNYMENIDPVFITKTNHTAHVKYQTESEKRVYFIKELDAEILRLQFCSRPGKIKKILNS
jgi:plasmid replication initiation protein